MSKRKKIAAIVGGSIAGLIVLLLLTTLIIVQTSWFQNYVREKIVATVQESSGGTVELHSFEFDPWHLTVRMRDFILHGTEPAGQDPLARIALLEVHLKLFSGIAHTVDLAYVGIQQPRVNLIVFPNGKTNIPEPKTPNPPSNSNGLETIVNLEIGEFHIDNGLLKYAQQSSQFSGQGRNLRALLTYNTLNPSYAGNLSIDPLVLAQGSHPPIELHVNLPVTIEKNAVRLANATLSTNGSKIVVDGALWQINAPIIDATVKANLGLAEWQRSFDLPIDTTSKNVPHELSAELSVHIDEKSNTITLKTAHIALGRTTFQASGTLQDPSHPSSAAQFNGNLDLAELGRLLKVTSPQASGAVLLNGTAKLDAQNNYQVNGTINSRDLSLRRDGTQISDVKLYTPFHADPYLISLDGLKLNAFGGSLDAKIFVEKLQNLSVEGNLHNLSLPVLAASFTGNRLGYDGTLSGSLRARGDLKAKGTAGYSADANLAIAPGSHGVPVSGRIVATYSGASGIVDLGNSYVALPNSRLDLNGALNHQLNVKLVSRNLNDFLPAANFGAKQPTTSLPVSLQQGGSATVQAAVTGNLSAPQITGNVAVRRFAMQQRSFDQLSLDLNASPSNATVRNGLLTRGDLRTNFDAAIGLRKWAPVPSSPVSANLTMRNASVPDLLSLAGESSIPATGTLTADVHINGTYGDPLGSAIVEVANGAAYKEPFNRILAQVNLSHNLISLLPLQVSTDAGSVTVTGTFRHPSDSFLVGDAAVHVTSDNLQLAKLNAVKQQNPGAAGTLQLSADAALSVSEVNKKSEVDIQNVSADVAARSLRWQNQSAGDLTLTARTANGAVRYQLTSDFAGSNVNVSGRTDLKPDYATVADLNIQNLSVEKVLAIAGQGTVPATGTLSAQGHVSGTMKAPEATLSFALANANVYQERIDQLSGDVRYSSTLLDVRSLQLHMPAGSVDLAASFQHPANDFNSGSAKLNVKTGDIDLARIEHVHQAQPTLSGRVHLIADAAADVRASQGKPSVLLRSLNADAGTQALSLQRRDLGEASLTAKTAGSTVNFRFDSDIAKSQIHAAGNSQLSGDYPTNATLSFANIRYSNIAPFLSAEPESAPAFEALVEGQASVKGPVLNIDELTGRLQLNHLQASTSSAKSPTGAPAHRVVTIENQGPIVLSLNKSILNVEQFHLGGPGTKVDASGTAAIAGSDGPLNLQMNADLDLGTLQDVDRDFYSSGAVAMTAAVHGTLGQPLVNGRIDLKNANVNYAQLPNGISNANGTILLNGNGAAIESLNAESGGGKIAVTGFAGYSGRAVTFNVKAQANKVRVRYSGISVTTNAAITLTGTTVRSRLAGNVTVTRIAYNSSSDAGSLLSSFASKPPSTPTAPSPILAGLRLDIRILTAPDLRVVTTYADRLSVEANMTVRGTAVSPGILGRIVVTDGQLVFFGNTYTVNTGTINFYDPNSIQPVINIGLETLAQGVDVTLNVSGPMDNLQLSYTSDPPLSFEQIVELLATNTTPNDPNIVANQPQAPQQSMTQMGESAILGQAVADPLASRVQRVFGLSAFKIDPSVSGSNGQPSARVTLQQKIANNITFTYINDVTQANSEIVRVEWDLTPKLSAVALRDYNSNVSIELFYKFKVK